MVRAIGLPAVNVRGNNIIKAKTKAEATGKGKARIEREKKLYKDHLAKRMRERKTVHQSARKSPVRA